MKRMTTYSLMIFCLISILAGGSHAQSKDEGPLPSTRFGFAGIDTEKARADMISLCDEADLTIRVYAGYTFLNNTSLVQSDNDAIDEIRYQINLTRRRLSEASSLELSAMALAFTETSIESNKVLLRRMRTNPEIVQTMDLAEKWFIAKANNDNNASGGGDQAVNLSAGTLADKTRQLCEFESLSKYPSAEIVAFARSVVNGFDIIVGGVDETIGTTNVPNPIYYIFLFFRTALSAGLIAIEELGSRGTYCQDLAFNLQSDLVNTGDGFILHAMLKGGLGYADMVKQLVTTYYNQVKGAGLNTFCVQAKLDEANSYYDKGDWVNALLKYRKAYQFLTDAQPKSCEDDAPASTRQVPLRLRSRQ